MKRRPGDSGFSMIELLVVVAIVGIIAAMSLPTAIRQVANYRLHADATAVSSWLNVARMKAASQFAPFRLDINVSSRNYKMEQLCGANSTDSACTGVGATAYTAHTTPSLYDRTGTQYLSSGDSFSSCRPTGITAYPGPITADAASCPDPLYLYFNTRGAAVDNSGNPLTNGGAVLYLNNSKGLVDAIVISIGGQVTVWNYSSGSWKLR